MLLIYTTNCCGCLEGAFAVLRFACPFLSLFVVRILFMLWLVLFCFVCHNSGGGTTPLLIHFYFLLTVFAIIFFKPKFTKKVHPKELN